MLFKRSTNKRWKIWMPKKKNFQEILKLEGTIRTLKNELKEAEESQQDGLEREAELKEQLRLAESRLNQGAEMVRKLQKELEEQIDRSQDQMLQNENEIEMLRQRLAAQANDLLKGQEEVTAQRNRIFELEKTLQMMDAQKTKRSPQAVVRSHRTTKFVQ
uniref:Uncharacterized protein n=1 Tax=Acrobeloides nanus TaxID=290746 RepID=A0A914DFM5_9BILA